MKEFSATQWHSMGRWARGTLVRPECWGLPWGAQGRPWQPDPILCSQTQEGSQGQRCRPWVWSLLGDGDRPTSRDGFGPIDGLSWAKVMKPSLLLSCWERDSQPQDGGGLGLGKGRPRGGHGQAELNELSGHLLYILQMLHKEWVDVLKVRLRGMAIKGN